MDSVFPMKHRFAFLSSRWSTAHAPEKQWKAVCWMIVAICVCVMLIACASPQPVVSTDVDLPADIRVQVGDVQSRISSQEASNVDITGLMRAALEQALVSEGIAASPGATDTPALLNVNVVGYMPGSAFGRWLLPGVGATVLSVEGNVTEKESGKVLARIRDERGVYAGGLYTIGAWKTIFDTVARDVASNLANRLTRKGFVVEVDSWLKRDFAVAKADPPGKLYLEPVRDGRPDKRRIGERFAAFGVSMGDVFFYRPVADYVREMIEAEILAAGNQLSGRGEGRAVSVEIQRFLVDTETTPLYWDINGAVELAISVASVDGAAPERRDHFSCKANERTYIWPTEEIVSRVMDRCLVSLMQDVRRSSIWRSN